MGERLLTRAAPEGKQRLSLRNSVKSPAAESAGLKLRRPLLARA